MRLAFLDLPDDQVDLISTARQAPDVDLVLVVHADPDALALKIAEVLQIPRSTEPLDLLQLKPDRVALPSLDSPGAAALLRAGISPGIFTALHDLPAVLSEGLLSSVATNGEPTPIEEWEEGFEEATGTGATLGTIREALALSEDRQRLFREILALAVAEAGADAGSIMVVDEEEGELRIAFADGLSPDTVRTTRQRIGEGVAGSVARDGKPLIINERVSDPRYQDSRERSRIAAAMSAPILLDGRVIGVLNVSSDRPGKRFVEEDLTRLTELGAQTSAILDRVVRRSRSDLDAIEFRARRALEQAFQTSEAPLAERLRAATTRLADQLTAGAANVYLADPAQRRFTVISSGSAPGSEGTIPIARGIVARAHQEGEAFFLATRVAPPDWRAGESTPNLLVAPIIGARAHGVLTLECVTRIETDLEAFTRLTSRVAGYLARLIESQRDDGGARRSALLALLSDIAPRLMVVREPEALVVETLGAVRGLFPHGLVAVRLLGRDDELVLRTAYDGPDDERARVHEREASLAAKVIAEGLELSPATMEEIDLHGPSIESGDGLAAVVPVRTSDRVAGSIGVVLRSEDVRDGAGLAPPELEALRKVALYASIAWEHVRGLGGAERETHDRLTGLLAGAGLEARIEEEVKRAERYHDRFLLTVCVFPQFTRLASQHGPAWSERLLREFAVALSRNVREVDAVARIGDGRFAVLSPETDKDSGALLRRLDLLVPRLECVRTLPDPSDVRLEGRQFTYPDEIPTGGELLALIRDDH
ncbi:MAG TPA: GAF domain-containing protein [Candidatus Eisenbacteria bacterium]